MHNASCMKISTKENDNMQHVTSVGACYVAIAIIKWSVFFLSSGVCGGCPWPSSRMVQD